MSNLCQSDLPLSWKKIKRSDINLMSI